MGTVIGSCFLLLAPQLSGADFKYTKTIQITGAVPTGLMKLGSRVGGKESLPDSSAYTSRPLGRRVEKGDVAIELIDLEAQHTVRMDAKKKTYVALRFEQYARTWNSSGNANKSDERTATTGGTNQSGPHAQHAVASGPDHSEVDRKKTERIRKVAEKAGASYGEILSRV